MTKRGLNANWKTPSLEGYTHRIILNESLTKVLQETLACCTYRPSCLLSVLLESDIEGRHLWSKLFACYVQWTTRDSWSFGQRTWELVAWWRRCLKHGCIAWANQPRRFWQSVGVHTWLRRGRRRAWVGLLIDWAFRDRSTHRPEWHVCNFILFAFITIERVYQLNALKVDNQWPANGGKVQVETGPATSFSTTRPSEPT